MHIKDEELYTNNQNQTETPKHAWYFKQYEQLPPQIRTIPNLLKSLKKTKEYLEQQGENLPFPIHGLTTIYSYAKKFDWDKRILKNIGTPRKKQIMINSDYMIKLLWEDTFEYHALTRKQRDKINWDKIQDLDDTTKIKNLTEIQKSYDTSFKTLTGEPTSIANMYAMIEVLKATEDEDSNRMDLINNLLLKGSKDDE